MPAFGSISTLEGADRTNSPIPVPTGVVANSLILVGLYIESDGAVTPPSGFTQVGFAENNTSGSEHRWYLFWKRATGSDTGDYTFNHALAWTSGSATRVDNAITTGDPFDVASVFAATTTNASLSPAVSLTTATTNTLLFFGASSFTGTDTYSPPSGFTEQIDVDEYIIATKLQNAPGATGTVQATASGTSAQSAFLAAVKHVVSADNLLNPSFDQSNVGNWTTDTGATTALYAAIDENTATDTDFIQSPAGPATAVYEVVLEGIADPASSTGHVVRYRYRKSVAADVVDLTVALMQGATEIASWTHAGVGTAFTTTEQTLTAAQADAITDYTDLRLRFTANTTTNDTTPAKVADRATLNSNTAGTTFDHVLSGLTVDNYLIIRTAADNSGGGGAARTVTVTNQSGTAVDTVTALLYQQNNDPGAASAGTTLNVIIAKITATSGTVRITYSGSVIQASVAEEWSGVAGTVVGTPVGANGTASTNLASMTDSSIAVKNLAYGAVSVEGPNGDTFTQDADTTNGSWSSLTKAGTTLATATDNQSIVGGYKVPTATGGQTYNPTNSVARDSAGLLIELTQGAATTRAQVSWAQFELPVVEAINHTRTQTDTLGSADNVTIESTSDVTDSLGLADVHESVAAQSRSETDVVGLLDEVATDPVVTSQLGITDSVSFVGNLTDLRTDSLSLADAVEISQNKVATVTDPVGITDKVAVPIKYLSDDFDDGVLGSYWDTTGALSSVDEAGGRLRIRLHSDYPQIETYDHFDLTGSSLTVEAFPATALHDYTVFFVADLPIDVDCPDSGVVISFGHWMSGVTVPYDPVAHRWWRFRETAGSVYIETSPDAVVWTSHWTASTASIAVMGTVMTYAGNADVDPATASTFSEFDNLNLLNASVTQSESVDISDSTGSSEVTYNRTVRRMVVTH